MNKDYFKISRKKKEHILAVINNTLKKYKQIKAASVFGSFINAKYFHDIDIAVIGKLNYDKVADIELELSKKTGFEVGIKQFDSLKDIPDLFKFSIFQGKSIIDRMNLNDYKYSFINHYIDFLEFRRIKDI